MARTRKSAEPIHPSVKLCLGYEVDEPDDEVRSDWKIRKSRACKPCWELKYCPYGPLVEQSPLLPSLKADAVEHRDHLARILKTGMIGDTRRLTEKDREQYEEWLGNEGLLLRQALYQLKMEQQITEVSKIENDQEKLDALGGQLPPIQTYRTPSEIRSEEVIEENFSPAMWQKLRDVAAALKKKCSDAIATQTIDDRLPLDPVRRLFFEREVDKFDSDQHPDHISQDIAETQCNIFGHICPVFFAAEAITETSEPRRMGRRPIPFATMMRIVRRDDYRCQHCKKKLRDDEVEFDHVIPVSKGGSSEKHNLRLTCFKCNRDKKEDYVP